MIQASQGFCSPNGCLGTFETLKRLTLPGESRLICLDLSGLPNDLSGLPNAQLLSFDTGGSSGKASRVIHSTDTLSRAVEGLQSKIGLDPISSVCCLPLHHLGGWMQVHRAVRTPGSVFFCSYRDLGSERLSPKIEDRWLSLVPTQLFHLLKSPQALKNLRKARGIFVGGAAMSPKLSDLCRKENLPVWPTYGMSETAGMITLLSADEFLNGQEEWGKLFLMPICVCRMTGAEYRFGPKAFAWRNLRISLVRGFLFKPRTMGKSIGWAIGKCCGRATRSS